MTNFNYKASDFRDPASVARKISGPNSERNLKTSRSTSQTSSDPLDVTLFSMSQILLGIPGRRTGEEIMALIQQQVFNGFETIAGSLDAIGLSGLLPEGVRNEIGDVSPGGGNYQFSLYGPDGKVPAFEGQYTSDSEESINKVISLAAAEVGYQESPPGSNNQKFAEIAGVQGSQPWCATFLMAIFKQAGFDQGDLLTPSTRETVAKYEAVGRAGSQPHVGSLVLFAFNGSTINHMGIVTRVLGGGKIETIEGNTSSTAGGDQRNSGVVAKKTRSSDIAKYVYPVYPGEPGIPLPGVGGGMFNPGAPPAIPASTGSGTAFRWHPATGANRDSGGAAPGAKALMDAVLAKFTGTSNMGIYNYRSIVGGSGLSVHSEGRALDIGVPVTDAGRTLGDHVFSVLAPAAWNLGIQRIVWYRRIWQANNPSGKAYGGSHPHTDHLHVELTREAASGLSSAMINSALTSYASGFSQNIPVGA